MFEESQVQNCIHVFSGFLIDLCYFMIRIFSDCTVKGYLSVRAHETIAGVQGNASRILAYFAYPTLATRWEWTCSRPLHKGHHQVECATPKLVHIHPNARRVFFAAIRAVMNDAW